MMRIGILGGSFDPVHKGHLSLARAALQQLKFDLVYFLLSPRSPFKQHHHQTSVGTRKQMLRLAIEKNAKFRIALWELKRRGPSYTVDTLRAYKKKNPSHELFLILGSDAFLTFNRWKNPKEIKKYCQLVIGRRPGASLKKSTGSLFVLRGIFPKISSTQIRRQAGLRKSVRDLVPSRVAQYISKEKVYRDRVV